MLFKLESALVLAMAALSVAQPGLQARASVQHYMCGEHRVSKEEISSAIGQLYKIQKEQQENKKLHFAYPKRFFNHCKDGECFQTTDELTEFPITTTPWTSKSAPTTPMLPC